MSIGSWACAALLVAGLMIPMAPGEAAEQPVSDRASELCSVQSATPATEIRAQPTIARASAAEAFAPERATIRALIARIGAERKQSSDKTLGPDAQTLAACTRVHCCGRTVSCCGRADCRRKCPCWPRGSLRPKRE